MTSYEIINKLREISLMRDAINEETGEYLYTEDEIAKLEDEISATKEQKLNAIQDYKLSLNDEITRAKDKKAKQDENIKRIEAHQDYLKELQSDLLGGEKLKTDEYTFSYRKTKSVNITSKEDIKTKFFKTVETITIDKIALKKAIEDGEECLGAEIVEKISLSVG